MTRSAIKPRLLFPSEDQLRERELGADDDIDEEAVTDIEMPNADSPIREPEDLATPVQNRSKPATPPTTNRATRSAGKKRASSSPVQSTPILEEGPEPVSMGADESFPGLTGERKGRSPFDSWQRTKSGRKRAGDPVEEGASGGKRTRSGMVESPLT